MSPAAPKRTSSPKGQPAAPSASDPGPSLRFHYDPGLQARALQVLEALEQAEDPLKHRDDLGEVVVELTHAGLDAYFIEPLKAAEAGFMAQQSASLGLGGARRVMGPIIRSIIGRMDPPQLLSICASIRRFMH